MNRHTFGKWLLACVAISFAYACQPNKPTPDPTLPPPTPAPKTSSCGCTQAPAEQALNDAKAKLHEVLEEPMQIIEIADDQAVVAEEPVEQVAEFSLTPESVEDKIVEKAAEPKSDTALTEIILIETPETAQVQSPESITLPSSKN